jgi:hypothetical protein
MAVAYFGIPVLEGSKTVKEIFKLFCPVIAEGLQELFINN